MRRRGLSLNFRLFVSFIWKVDALGGRGTNYIFIWVNTWIMWYTYIHAYISVSDFIGFGIWIFDESMWVYIILMKPLIAGILAVVGSSLGIVPEHQRTCNMKETDEDPRCKSNQYCSYYGYCEYKLGLSSSTCDGPTCAKADFLGTQMQVASCSVTPYDKSKQTWII